MVSVPLGRYSADDVPFITAGPLPVGNLSDRFAGGEISVPSGRTNAEPKGTGNESPGLETSAVPGGRGIVVVEAPGPSIVMAVGLPEFKPTVRVAPEAAANSVVAVPFGNINSRVPPAEARRTLTGVGGAKITPSAVSHGSFPPGSIDGRSVVVPAGSRMTLPC